MKFEDVKTPEDLFTFMEKHIQYGFVDGSGKIYTPSESEEKFDEDCKSVWRLASPEDIIKNGYGQCWDQVELERYWFLENGYKIKTLYIWFELDFINPYNTHTYLIYEEGDKFCLFEHADEENKGIRKFDSYKDALYHQMGNHIRSNNRVRPMGKDIIECLHIYEYAQPPYGLEAFEFIDFILDEGTKIL